MGGNHDPPNMLSFIVIFYAIRTHHTQNGSAHSLDAELSMHPCRSVVGGRGVRCVLRYAANPMLTPYRPYANPMMWIRGAEVWSVGAACDAFYAANTDLLADTDNGQSMMRWNIAPPLSSVYKNIAPRCQ